MRIAQKVFALFVSTILLQSAPLYAETRYYSGPYPSCSLSGGFHDDEYRQYTANGTASFCVYQPAEGYFTVDKSFIKADESFTLTWVAGADESGRTGFPGWHRATDFNNGTQTHSLLVVSRVDSFDTNSSSRMYESFGLYPKYGETSCAGKFSCEYELDRGTRFQGYYKLEHRVFVCDNGVSFSVGGYTHSQIEIVKNAPPIAAFTTTAAGNNFYDLDATASSDDGKIADYYWTVSLVSGQGNDPGTVPNGAKSRVRLTGPAEYQITLELYDDQGGYGSKTTKLVVPASGSSTPIPLPDLTPISRNEAIKNHFININSFIRDLKVDKKGKFTKGGKVAKAQISEALKTLSAFIKTDSALLEMKKPKDNPKKYFAAIKSKLSLALKGKSSFKQDLNAAKKEITKFNKALK